MTSDPSVSVNSTADQASRTSTVHVSASPIVKESSSASQSALEKDDEENVTITSKRTLSHKAGKQKSQEDIRLLAISTHMTELSYTISDIQTRIFEIQELRHKSQSAGDSAGTTAIIDQALMNLDERIESVSKGMKVVNESLEPVLRETATPKISQHGESNENALLLRKHATLVSEWEAVQDESDVLREELKEDKWLTVFRTVTDQADGMMSSLEKGVNRCQEFIWQVRKGSDSLSNSQSSHSSPKGERPPPTIETLNSLLDSFEAKKKHYMPATSKVLSIIDKGVRDRVTKNGETLRRHAESAQRWRNLRERIARTDSEMAAVRQILLTGDDGSAESTGKNGYLNTPVTARAPSAASTISRSMSPLKKFARKLTGTVKSPTTPVTPLKVTKNNGTRTPVSEPSKKTQSVAQVTPERPSHRYSQSYTPDPSPRTKVTAGGTVKGSALRPAWNSSTKVSDEERSKATLPRRPPSAAGHYGGDIPPVPSVGDFFRRSLSRASMASSRPWSPLTSSISTTNSASQPMRSTPSRSQTPSRAPSRAMSYSPALASPTPRPRPQTPSHIPGPSQKLRYFSGSQSDFSGNEDDLSTGIMQRAYSPAFSTSAMSSSGGPPPRPPSRSMIPVPSVKLSSPSRAGSAMSNYKRSESPATPFRAQAARAQTPESALRARAQQVPVYQGSVSGRSSGRPSLSNKLPPSSFRDGAPSRVSSRPGSRAGAYTPVEGLPLHEYIPSNYQDPLDVEVAQVANSISHGLLVERVDPPLTKTPKQGEEIKAQYAFSNASSRKVVTLRLTTLTRTGRGETTTSKKVMCRVGGGWQDLSHYILNRQAGI